MGQIHSKKQSGLKVRDYHEIWVKHFGEKEERLCPVCQVGIMTRKRISGNKYNWERAFIRYDGLDNMENSIPICYRCAQKYNKNKKINLIDIAKDNYDKTILY